jgi:acyl-CoA reductase-like NAD-dependent aldehyde dehydrogenase
MSDELEQAILDAAVASIPEGTPKEVEKAIAAAQEAIDEIKNTHSRLNRARALAALLDSYEPDEDE